MGMKLPPATEKAVLAAAGLTPAKRKRPAADVRTIGGYGLHLELTLPVRVVSEANRRDFWRVAKARGDAQASALEVAVAVFGLGGIADYLPGPVRVTITHVGPVLDGDNLQRAGKRLRDEIAKWLGVDDGDPRVQWSYDQTTDGVKCVRVRVEATR